MATPIVLAQPPTCYYATGGDPFQSHQSSTRGSSAVRPIVCTVALVLLVVGLAATSGVGGEGASIAGLKIVLKGGISNQAGSTARTPVESRPKAIRQPNGALAPIYRKAKVVSPHPMRNVKARSAFLNPEDNPVEFVRQQEIKRVAKKRKLEKESAPQSNKEWIMAILAGLGAAATATILRWTKAKPFGGAATNTSRGQVEKLMFAKKGAATSTKTGVLIINTGTPDSTEVEDVRNYLKEFLMDDMVINVATLFRWFLVNVIIAPFRAPKSAEVYKQVWEKRGSPLKFYTEDARGMLQGMLDEEGSDIKVWYAMRYQNPSMKDTLEEMRRQGIGHVIIVPAFPQYAHATTGSIVIRAMEIIRSWSTPPNVTVVNNFHREPAFIEAWQENISKAMEESKPDLVLFTYHGVPESHITTGVAGGGCNLEDTGCNHCSGCCGTYNMENYLCYRAQCYDTSRLIAKKCGLKEGEWDVAFQSRLGDQPWLQPYLDAKLKECLDRGQKKLLVAPPSFVSDCLETSIELGVEYKEEFLEMGGEEWNLVPALNDSKTFIRCLKDLVLKETVLQAIPDSIVIESK